MILDQMDPLAPAPERRPFGLVRVVLSTVLAGALVVASVTVPLPILAVHPGPTPDISKLITVDAPTSPPEGSFHLTTVTLYEATLADALRAWFSSTTEVIPRSAIYPPGKSRDEVRRETAAQMSESQYAATIAALRHLGYELPPEGALVRATLKDTPGEKHLRPGDVIVAVDGAKVTTLEDLRTLLGDREIGEEAMLTVRREGETIEVVSATIASDEEPQRPVVGIETIQNTKLPFAVSIKAGDIGGPSAGLMFALALVDLLDPEDLSGGKVVAGTGTIDVSGKIGAVGGVTQKLVATKCARRIESDGRETCRSADIFLVPAPELDEAQTAAHRGVVILGVSTLGEAVDTLKRLAASGG